MLREREWLGDDNSYSYDNYNEKVITTTGNSFTTKYPLPSTRPLRAQATKLPISDEPVHLRINHYLPTSKDDLLCWSMFRHELRGRVSLHQFECVQRGKRESTAHGVCMAALLRRKTHSTHEFERQCSPGHLIPLKNLERHKSQMR